MPLTCDRGFESELPPVWPLCCMHFTLPGPGFGPQPLRRLEAGPPSSPSRGPLYDSLCPSAGHSRVLSSGPGHDNKSTVIRVSPKAAICVCSPRPVSEDSNTVPGTPVSPAPRGAAERLSDLFTDTENIRGRGSSWVIWLHIPVLPGSGLPSWGPQPGGHKRGEEKEKAAICSHTVMQARPVDCVDMLQ